MEKSENLKKELSNKTVLIVDDDPVLLKLYERYFVKRGVNVKLAESGQEGLDIMKKKKPDMVILDIRMPGLDGIEVLKIMREDLNLKDIPVIILTNYDIPDYREKAKNLGAIDFSLKISVNPSEFVNEVINQLIKK